jgi:ribosomal protein L13
MDAVVVGGIDVLDECLARRCCYDLLQSLVVVVALLLMYAQYHIAVDVGTDVGAVNMDMVLVVGIEDFVGRIAPSTDELRDGRSNPHAAEMDIDRHFELTIAAAV